MYHLSPDYLYVLKAAFKSEPFYATLYSLPSLACALFIVLCAVTIVIIGVELKIYQTANVREALSAQGMMFVLGLWMLGFSALFMWTIPAMSSIHYSNPYVPTIVEITKQKAIDEMTDFQGFNPRVFQCLKDQPVETTRSPKIIEETQRVMQQNKQPCLEKSFKINGR